MGQSHHQSEGTRQHVNESLVLQAHAWLARMDAGHLTPEHHPELLNLALACHQRMLELGEHDRAAAVELAIAGADLLQAFQRHTPPDSAVPEWALVHEEQCCRYGAIWMHDQLQQNPGISPQRLQRAIGLLQRLQELHPEPIAWIANMCSDLQQAVAITTSTETAIHRGSNRVASDATTDDLRLVVVGNCQAHPLTLGLRLALPKARIHASPSVHLAEASDVAVLHRRLADAELLVMHRIQPGYRDSIGLDSDTLRQLLPATARSVVLPSLHYEGHHPWIAYAHDPEGQLAAHAAESPLDPYHDFLAMAAAHHGLPLEVLLDPVCPPQGQALLRQQHHHSLDELKRREADCDLAISDWIALHHQVLPLTHTINHPTQAALDQLLRRLLQRLGQPHQLGPDLFDPCEHLGDLSIPIHPWVRQALALDSWAQHWGRRQGHPYTIEQQLEQSHRFYQRHPWIAEQNHTHPKFKLAEELLQQQQQHQPHSHTTRNRPQNQPRIAALINYYNDEDMLAWQLQAGCLDHYDRIYIWDGPYSYQQRLPLFGNDIARLDQTALGKRLLADPRVVYCHRSWAGEAEKRIDAYNAVQEDLVVLHDTDEFFLPDASRLQDFWLSPYAVASQRTQNLYAGGLQGSDAHHTGESLNTLPLKRVLFRRQAISPERHLDYCWLVGVQQQPTDERCVQPEPIGHAYHLTACRTARGQAAKMSFYMSLALAERGPGPVVERLRELVEAGSISQPEAQRLFLQGDPGYAGVPHPAFDLRLRERLQDPGFPLATLESILSQANPMQEGHYQLLSNYPLHLWFPATGQDQRLHLQLAHTAELKLQSWTWRHAQAAARGCDLQCSSALELQLPHEAAVLGWLLAVTVIGGETPPQLHQLHVGRRS